MDGDTIAGIASGMGGGIGVIRVSGPDAFYIVSSIFRTKKFLNSFKKESTEQNLFMKKETEELKYSKNNETKEQKYFKNNETIDQKYSIKNEAKEQRSSKKNKPKEQKYFKNNEVVDQKYFTKEKIWDSDYLLKKESHTIQYGFIIDENDEVLDEVILLLMKAPRSYTCEDVIEIDCHGGAFVLQKILKLLVRKGARLAEPGEFTKRAFLHGRIDLSQAEAVMKMISSKSEFALDTAVRQLEGSLSKYISEIREVLLYHMGEIEAALDDPEHYSLEGYSFQLKSIVEEQMKKLDLLLKNFDNGRMKSEGIQTVIVGKPNAGKSSLMNLLLDEERAIVTNVAGTTRDILEESFRLGDLVLNLVDTAGIRETEDAVESIGVRKAVDYLKQADFVIYVVDISDSFQEEDKDIISLLEEKKGVILLNKSDVETESSFDVSPFSVLGWKKILFSAKEGIGLKDLEEHITELFLQGEISYNDQVYLTSLRHKEAVEQARKSLEQVLFGIDDGMPEDVLMVDLMDAYSGLGLIGGETASEDLVNKIFEEFCMGK